FALFSCQWFGATNSAALAGATYQQQEKKIALPQGVRNAIDYLAREHDRFHRTFIIYDDHASGGCHMFPSLWTGDLQPPQPEPAAIDQAPSASFGQRIQRRTQGDAFSFSTTFASNSDPKGGRCASPSRASFEATSLNRKIRRINTFATPATSTIKRWPSQPWW